MSALMTATLTGLPHLLPFVEDPPKLTDAGNAQIVLAAVLGIAAVVVLIVWVKMHPFLALMLGTAVMGIVAGVAPLDIVTSFTTGFGGTVGAVGLLIGLGAMLGALLADSGGGDTIVDTSSAGRPAGAALGDGADRGHPRAPPVLRGRGGAAGPGGDPGRPPYRRPR